MMSTAAARAKCTPAGSCATSGSVTDRTAATALPSRITTTPIGRTTSRPPIRVARTKSRRTRTRLWRGAGAEDHEADLVVHDGSGHPAGGLDDHQSPAAP